MRRILIGVTFATLIAFGTLAASLAGASQTGLATCYSHRLAGRHTSSGLRYHPTALTAAHHTIANGTHVRVTNLDNGRSAVVLIDDRLPRHHRRGVIIDLSHSACKELELGPHQGTAKVRLEVLRANAATKSH